MKHTRFLTALTYLLLSLIGLSAFSQNQFKATSTLDSTVIIQGSKTNLTVEFVGPLAENAQLIEFNPDSISSEIEINRANQQPAITDLGNGRKQLRQQYIVQAFDSGLYVLPPFECISGEETIRTNSPVLKVDPVSLDTTNLIIDAEGNLLGFNINDEVSGTVLDADYHFWDFMPDWVTDYWWLIILIVAVLALATFVYFRWLRHGKNPLRQAKKIIPPYDLAIRQLNILQSKQLWQKGNNKDYYTQLTDILRIYLNGRFHISAMEMTSPQIIDAVKANEETAGHLKEVDEVLQEADFVKFAKATPQAHENERAFHNVLNFVESTKPVEQPAEPEKTADTAADSPADKTQADKTQADKQTSPNPQDKTEIE